MGWSRFDPIFGASGTTHMPGIVPDPGSTSGTTHYLREDATWQVPPSASGGMAIGGAVSGGTTGSVLFIDASGNLAQDNTNFFWDGTGHVLKLAGELDFQSSTSTVKVSGTTVLDFGVTTANEWTATIPTAANDGSFNIVSSNTNDTQIGIVNNSTSGLAYYFGTTGSANPTIGLFTFFEARSNAGNGKTYMAIDGSNANGNTGDITILTNAAMGWNGSNYAGGLGRTAICYDGTDGALKVFNQLSLTSAASLRVYNKTDQAHGNTAPTNYERGIFDFLGTANQLTIGTQAGGTGVVRNIKFIAGTTSIFDYGVTTASVLSIGVEADLIAGTTSIAPLKFKSGTNLTTAAAGACEFDGSCFYETAIASARQVVNTEQVQNLSASRTFTNNTSAQAIFNASANGAITVAASTTYEFEMVVAASGFSSSAHTINFGFGGTAAYTSIGYYFDAQTSSTLATPTASNTGFIAVATATAIIASSTTTGLLLYVRGTMRISTGGTVIPQLTQVTASAAAVVQPNSFFRCWPIGSNTVTNVGNWS